MSGDSDEGRPDVSPAAVNQRLSAFVSEHKTALAKGDPRALRESDRLLCAMAEEALAKQAEGERLKAEAELAQAKLERLTLEQRGGCLQ